MIKEELIEIIAAKNGIPKTKSADILRTILETIQQRVVDGEKVSLVGFGVFEAVDAKARIGNNLKTRQPVHIAATRRPRFTAGRTFKNAVRGDTTESEE